MKSIFTITASLLILFLSASLHAQITTSSQWTWVKGDSTRNPHGVYGVRGVAAPANMPGAREGSVTWTDASGNFWLFGGVGYSSGSFGALNDLWKYSPVTNQWTWVKGDSISSAPGVYGTMGTPSAANTPGARYRSVDWTDNAGNLWLFGGYGLSPGISYIAFNDLWKYNPATNQWTWVKGANITNQPGVYGIKGMPSAANMPGARSICSNWTDIAGNLWLFAGYGYSSSDSVNGLNDLWKYDPATNQWTWVKGDSTPSEQLPVYGTMGIPSVANTPGSRNFSSSWTDAAGNFWLFGGGGVGLLNDLWKYSPVTNQWTWVKGDSTSNQTGVYGTLGTPSAFNKPGSRFLNSSWIDPAGNFWLFGGLGYSSSVPRGYLNDLWKYSSATNQWTWVKGDSTSNQPGVYGTMGTPSALNKPGANIGSSAWTDAAGNLWLFGGSGYSDPSFAYLNSLWKFGNSSVLPVTLSSIKAYQQSSGITIEWKVENESGIKQYDIEKSSNGITFTNASVQSAKGNNFSTVNYSWHDVNPVAGNNFYRIRSIGSDGETKYSQVIKVSIGKDKPAFDVYPNPVSNNNLQLQFISQAKGVYHVRLLNAFGQVILSERIVHEAGSSTQTINPGRQVVRGQYILEVTAPDKSRQSIKVIY